MGTTARGMRGLGRFSATLCRPTLAHEFADFVDPTQGQRVLDVGCGPGALTGVLVPRLGVPGVSAVDPSQAYVAAARVRLPGVDVRRAWAEDLPYAEGTFDVALAQLVVHFMADPGVGSGRGGYGERPRAQHPLEPLAERLSARLLEPSHVGPGMVRPCRGRWLGLSARPQPAAVSRVDRRDVGYRVSRRGCGSY